MRKFKTKVISVIAASLVLLLLGAAMAGPAFAVGPPEKHNVCHFDQSGKLHILAVITGGASDIAHHANHGDIDQDGDCPKEPPKK